MKQSDLKKFIHGQVIDEIRLLKFIEECLEHIYKEDSEIALKQFFGLLDHFNTVPSLRVISHNVENQKKFSEEIEE